MPANGYLAIAEGTKACRLMILMPLSAKGCFVRYGSCKLLRTIAGLAMI